ncbi:hypothetical protein PVNG_03091 [Plasmodium vivax North Korean]|uniref:Vir protein n=1 Tax=Plasmodium vivax North Korean TaxID=1035514 RepID=A0A0J9WEN8_PLAVI|nr:hypothetical protein PVNG_03091 [Plasmodium vivax North Korean]
MVIKSLDLPSEKFYERLNQDNTSLSEYNKECSSFSSIKKNKGLRRPCALLLKYLANSEKKSEKVNWAYDDCILLNYWIYGKIYEQRKDISKSAPAFGDLQRLWNTLIHDPRKTSYYNKCEPDNLIATQDDWWKRKELYDYFVDYNTLKGIVPIYDTHCEEIYMYLKEKDKLYKEYKENCSTTQGINCPDFFRECENKDPTILLKMLKCYGEMQSKEALPLKQEERPASAETYPGLTSVKADLPVDPQVPRDGTNPVTNSGNVLLGVVITSMTSGALYKFTPLGRMLRNGLGLNRNNINVHDNGLFDYASGPFNPYSGGEEHYIGYHQA